MRERTQCPWQAAGDGWVESTDGQSVVEYSGCGTHAADWRSPSDYALALAAPELLECLIAFMAPYEGIEVVPGSHLDKARKAITKADATF
jgi:hypothetical protein